MELYQLEAHRPILLNTINQLTYHIMSLIVFMELHNQTYHSMFSFSNRKLLTTQNRIIYKIHMTSQHSMVLDHDEQFRFHAYK